MSNIEAVITDTLVNDSAVAALVGTRVFWLHVPTSAARPYVSFQFIGEPAITHLDGVTNVVVARMQVNCIADTAPDVRELSDAVDDALTDQSGTLGPAGDTTDVRQIIAEGDSHGIEDPDDGKQTGVQRSIQDYFVWYRPT